MLDDLDPDQDEGLNVMGNAFLQYLAGDAASTPDRSTNPNATFYEWLEYCPLCIGTPGITPGAQDFKNVVNRVSYQNHDLGFVYVTAGSMNYERVLSDGGQQYTLFTKDFKPSSKGGKDAVAFVWDADANLWLHEHGSDGFVHASAKQGRKIRCSGMMVAENGKLTRVTNESGHYQPRTENIFQFLDWLGAKGCVAPNCEVDIKHDEPPIKRGLYLATKFVAYFHNQGKSAPPLPYPSMKP